MKLKLILVAFVILMIPLALATEITGDLSTDPDFYQEETPAEPQPPQDTSSSSGGGSGGGGSGGGTTVTSQNLSESVPKETTPSTEQNVPAANNNGNQIIIHGELDPTWDVSFEESKTLTFKINGEVHSLKINEIIDNQITFTLNSNSITDTLKKSQLKRYDLDRDDYEDLSVLFVGISDSKFQLELNKLDKPLGNSLTGAAIGVFQKGSWIYGFGILAMVILLAGGIVYFKSKKKR